MEVSLEILNRWQALRSPGDLKKITDSMDEGVRVSKETIRRVFTEGKCSDEVFKAVSKFYQDKGSEIAKYLLPAATA